MNELSPSKITAWLGCPHYLTLRHEVESDPSKAPKPTASSFAELLMRKGDQHEREVLDAYREAGSVEEVGTKEPGESMAAWASRSEPYLTARGADGADVLFQVPLVHDGIRGVADFLERGTDDDGTEVWTPVDAKLARREAKPGHVLQLCFYAEAIEALTGTAPEELRVHLGSGKVEPVRFEDVRPYWERLKTQLRAALDEGPAAEGTRPEPCDHCQFCEFQPTCHDQWRREDSLVFVAGVTRAERQVLQDAEVDTLEALAGRTAPVEGLSDDRLARIRTQAELQLRERKDRAEAERSGRERPKPPHLLIEPVDDEPVDDGAWGRGFEKLPEPDDADVFLDFEGHPFWTPERGLFFLFGYLCRDLERHGEWRFHELWAEDPTEEGERVGELVRFLAARRAAHPGMHVYHYNHTERSSLESLTAEHAVAESAFEGLLRSGAFVDLLPVVRNSLQAGVEGYGLKEVERLTGFERKKGIDKGAGAVVAFEEWQRSGDASKRRDIAAYNEDDVRATLALRDWLLSERPEGFEPVPPPDDPDREPSDIDKLLEALSDAEEGSTERLVADLLGYWIREFRVHLAEMLSKLNVPTVGRLEDEEVIACMASGTIVPATTPTGKPAKWPSIRLTFPEQPVPRKFVKEDRDEEAVSVDPAEAPGKAKAKTRPDPEAVFVGPDGLPRYVTVRGADPSARTVDIVWDADAAEAGLHPESIVVNDWVRTTSKSKALVAIAEGILDRGSDVPDDSDRTDLPRPATMALLEAAPPRFVDGGGPEDGEFTDDAADLALWVGQLDESVLAVQGPPGTGKTYRGAHMVRELVEAGKRVGIMSMSHKAIDNFVKKVIQVCSEEGVEPSIIKRGEKPARGGLDGVTYVGENDNLGSDAFNVVAGTAWAFCSKPVRQRPVDVLLIDEAGQLSLADAVAASDAAHNVVLLGDPLQLEQVAKADHPGGSGNSALGHMLGEDDETMPPDRGVFIEETWRMHPDICGFISERIYGGRLASYELARRQGTEVGTGLRWVKVDHEGCSTESREEADTVIAQVRDLLGRQWTDEDGDEHPMGPDDVMVVAAYNDQVNLIRELLDADPATAEVKVGTVDKFQGGEAVAVIFSMASSSSEDMPRGPEFLFSRNRLNVAISRARCLAYLVCSEELLNSHARTVEDMHLIANLCAFVERAEQVEAGSPAVS